MHRPVLAPILVSPLHVPMPSGKQQQQQKSSSFLSLDSPMSECESPFSIAESRRTSRTSYNDLPVDLDENTEQWASYGLHMVQTEGRGAGEESDEGLVNSDWIDGGEGDSPTTGDFEALSRAGSSSQIPSPRVRRARAVPRYSPVSSQGSSWSSSRQPGAPSVVLSFQSNGQFQLSAPPSSKRSRNGTSGSSHHHQQASHRGSSSTLGSNFSYSAAQQIALANRAARLSASAAASSIVSSSLGPATAQTQDSLHRHSVGSAGGLAENRVAAAEPEEEQNLTPAQEFIRNIRKKQEARDSNPTCWRWEEAIAAEREGDIQETLDGGDRSASSAANGAESSTNSLSHLQQSQQQDQQLAAQGGAGRIKNTLGKWTGLRKRTKSVASQSSSSLRSELGRPSV